MEQRHMQHAGMDQNSIMEFSFDCSVKVKVEELVATVVEVME